MPFVVVFFWMAAALFAGAAVEVREDDRAIEVWSNDKMVLRYHKTESPVPEGVPKLYRRSGYIHPVLTPDGTEVTGDFPEDHLHQHALFMAWTSGKYGDKKLDFWNQKKEEGRVAHKRVVSKISSDKRAEFVVELSHFDQADPETEIIRETWKVTVHLFGEDDHFVFDIESSQLRVGNRPFTVEKNRYGGMALRGNAAWLGSDACEFRTSEGKEREAGNHTRPNWVEMAGEIDGEFASIVVFGHPDNFRAPQTVRIHPEKPYFCFAPMVEGRFSIGSERPFVSRYRYLVSRKRVDKDFIEKHWKLYSALR